MSILKFSFLINSSGVSTLKENNKSTKVSTSLLKVDRLSLGSQLAWNKRKRENKFCRIKKLVLCSLTIMST